MKKSELVKRLQKEIDENGDGHIRSVKCDELEESWETYLLSPDRRNAQGQRAKMNHKEFIKYCEENPL